MSDLTQETYTSLAMDRSLAVGNSKDVFDRRALHVKVGNKSDEAIPVYLTDDTSGVGYFNGARTLTTPSTQQTLMLFTVPADTKRYINKVTVVCRQESSYEIYKNTSILIGSGRTGAAHPSDTFDYSPKFELVSGDTVTIKFLARGAASDVEHYLQASDIPT